MALPTPEKTWLLDANVSCPAQGSACATNRYFLLELKDTLIAGTSAWAVKGSSDSATAGMDDVDRWVDVGDLIWGTGNHSWIVLEQSNIATGFQICIDLGLTATVCNAGYIYVSPSAGFTGGAINARPTATDEYSVLATTTDLLVLVTDTGTVLDVWRSSDGQCWRICRFSASAAIVFATIDKAKNPVAGWSAPHVVSWRGNPTYAALWDSANAKTRIVGNNVSVFLTTEGCGANAAGEQINVVGDVDAGYLISPIGVLCTTAGSRGRHGQLFDLWYGPNANVNTGDTYPNDASRQFIQVGHLVLPWDGSLPIIAI